MKIKITVFFIQSLAQSWDASIWFHGIGQNNQLFPRFWLFMNCMLFFGNPNWLYLLIFIRLFLTVGEDIVYLLTDYYYFPHERQQSNGFLRNPFFLLIFFQFLSTVQCLIAYYRLLLFLTPGTQSANFLSPESGSNKFTYQKILNKLNGYWNCKSILSDICLKKSEF